MKPEFLTDPNHIKAWLESMGIKKWRINKAGLVDTFGVVDLDGVLGELKQLPVRFGSVGLNFLCRNNQLVNLEGSPKEVGGYFSCDRNKLVTLKGGPSEVAGGFDCSDNQLVNLVGSPKEVVGSFYCNSNQLTNLVGSPKEIGGNFECRVNNLVDFIGLEGANIGGRIYPIEIIHIPDGKTDNTIVSLNGLREEYYSKVQGLDIEALKYLDQASSLDVMV